MAILPLSLADFDAVLFDLDGVLTDSAVLHARSWKALFDDFLRDRSDGDFRPFDVDKDYRTFVDGKPRHEGTQSFLASRSVTLAIGEPDDSPSVETIHGLGARKNAFFLKALENDGITTFPAAVAFLKELRAKGFSTALVSSSRNSREIVKRIGLLKFFDGWIDGNDVLVKGLQGKPAPDMFLAAASQLGVKPGRAVVVEDAIAGVEAGINGRFGLVIGVDRTHHPDALADAGAHIVVSRLSDVPVAEPSMKPIDELPSAIDEFDDILARTSGKRLAVCLDYDGTLTPIVDRPELAVLSTAMRATLERLTEIATVSIVSGRGLAELRRLVPLTGAYFAGSHGFEIGRPNGSNEAVEHGSEFIPLLDQSERELKERLASIDGVLVERKRLSVAVHYRLVAEGDRGQVKTITDEVAAAHPELRRTLGKMVFDLQPDIDWHKGKAVGTLLESLDLAGDDVLTIYIGDDVTDEDAFRELGGQGIGIVVRGSDRKTSAKLSLRNVKDVGNFLDALVQSRWPAGSDAKAAS